MEAKLAHRIKTSIVIIVLAIISTISTSEPEHTVRPLNETILNTIPWSIKLLLLRDIEPQLEDGSIKQIPKQKILPHKQIKFIPAKSEPVRRVGVQALIQRRQNADTDEGTLVDDENSMRLKLFRLMYETVRDSDLKVRRAELIRRHYINKSSWEIGYLMAELQEKFDIINEFSSTLKKFYNVWKPIEHINAYEQISNYAIQINHLVDLIKTVSKDAVA